MPHVEARKRREDRWERHVLELGELLSGDLSQASRDVEVQADMVFVLRRAEGLAHVDRNRWETAWAEHRERLHDVTTRFTGLAGTRASWLSRRITSGAPEELAAFRVAWIRSNVTEMMAEAAALAPDSHDELRQAWKDERDSREYLLEQVEALAEAGPPPRRRGTRLRRVLRRLRVWASKRRAVWQLITPAGRRWRAEERDLEHMRAASDDSEPPPPADGSASG